MTRELGQHRLPNLNQTIKHCAELDFDSIWLVRHFLGRVNPTQPTVLLINYYKD